MGDIANLGSPLAALLIRTGLIALAVALLVGLGTQLWAARHPRPDEHDDDREHAEPRARAVVRIGLGALWIIDGLLQMQPLMPAGFVQADIAPHAADEPGWLSSVVAVLTRAWDRHPVVADVALVWLEIGIGLCLLLVTRGLGARLIAWFAIVVALVIWIAGEAVGGLLAAGAGWLTGAPGAALVYAAMAALLLVPVVWWEHGRAQTLVRYLVAGWLVIAAVLQALPAEGFWTASQLSAPFVSGARTSQPDWLSAPLRSLARLAVEHTSATNLAVVVMVLAAAAWLVLTSGTAAVVATLVLIAATWWLGQDFGVLGGTATDPNTCLPLGVLLAAALPTWQAARSKREREPATASSVRGFGRRAGVSLGLVLALAVPMTLAIATTGAADSAALAADSSGGLRTVPDRRPPSFALVDQRGRAVSTESLRGKVVVLTFLDPVCTSECPLIANQLALADRRLGPLAARVEFVAVDTNPVFHSVADVNAFTVSHGLGTLPNWHFLCGSPERLQQIAADYGIAVQVPSVGMIEHSEGMFFLTAAGREAAYLDDGAANTLTQTYAERITAAIRTLLQ